MPDQVTRWQANDSTLWDTEHEADMHEAALDAREHLQQTWYRGCIENVDELITFVLENKLQIESVIAGPNRSLGN